MKDRLLPLRHILDAIELIESYTAAGKRAFLHETMRRDAIARNLEVIGEAVTRLPETRDFPWRDPIDMRNWLIHRYDVVDLDVVWDTATVDIPVLKGVVIELLAGDG